MKGPRPLGQPLGMQEAANLHGVKAPDKPLKPNLNMSFEDMVRAQGGGAELDGDAPAAGIDTHPVAGYPAIRQSSAALTQQQPDATGYMPASKGIHASLDVDLLVQSKYQTRRYISQVGLEELALSISTNGGLNNPVIVRPLHDGKFEIVGGHRRHEVIQRILRWPKIDVIIRELTDAEAAIIAAMDNVDEPLSDYEDGMSYRARLDAGHFASQAEMARRLGVHESRVSRCIAYADLPADVHLLLDKDPNLIGASAAAGLSALVKEGLADLVIEAAKLVASKEATQEKALAWARYTAKRLSDNTVTLQAVLGEAKETGVLQTAEKKPEPAVEKFAVGKRVVATTSFQAKGKRLVMDFNDASEASELFAAFKEFMATRDE